MKTAIATVFSALSSSGYSHHSGLARIASRQLHEAGIDHDVLWTDDPASKSWENYDQILVYHGYDLNGKLGINMFGGTIQPNADRLAKLALFPGQATPIWYPMPDYVKLARLDRWGGIIPDAWIDKLESHMQRQLPPVKNATRGSSALTLGDSHAPSVWQDKHRLEVLSGQTLHGVVSDREQAQGPVDQLIGHHVQTGVRRLTVYFGNIDLRHHLGRQADPELATTRLAESYQTWLLKTLRAHCLQGIEVCALLGVESIHRDIPGPGRYRGEPFHGSWSLRASLRHQFNESMAKFCAAEPKLSFYRHPVDWTDLLGELDQSVMERPRSVHIAPKFYRAFR